MAVYPEWGHRGEEKTPIQPPNDKPASFYRKKGRSPVIPHMCQTNTQKKKEKRRGLATLPLNGKRRKGKNKGFSTNGEKEGEKEGMFPNTTFTQNWQGRPTIGKAHHSSFSQKKKKGRKTGWFTMGQYRKINFVSSQQIRMPGEGEGVKNQSDVQEKKEKK